MHCTLNTLSQWKCTQKTSQLKGNTQLKRTTPKIHPTQRNHTQNIPNSRKLRQKQNATQEWPSYGLDREYAGWASIPLPTFRGYFGRWRFPFLGFFLKYPSFAQGFNAMGWKLNARCFNHCFAAKVYNKVLLMRIKEKCETRHQMCLNCDMAKAMLFWQPKKTPTFYWT